jgi:immune inhibitor A
MGNNQKWLIAGIAGLVLVCLCVGALCLVTGGLAAFSWLRTTRSEIGTPLPQEATVQVQRLPTRTPLPSKTPSVSQPGTPAEAATQAATQAESPSPSDGAASETLKTLEEEVVPVNDPRQLAERFKGEQNIPEAITDAPKVYNVGDQQTFWSANVDTNNYSQVNAILQYVTPHLYFWVEDGVSFGKADLKRICDTFENSVYPKDRSFFGSEWTPGVDNDVHLYVLYAGNLGRTVGGYFSTTDEYLPETNPYSNTHEMFMLNADNVSMQGDEMIGIMAHEFQHMIHWRGDRNEEGWINEGFSELAQYLNGYDPGSARVLFARDPDLQLNYWPSPPESIPHYGSSFMFLSYLLDRFGSEATQAVVNDPGNGMDGIDDVLSKIGQVDPLTGKPILADDLFADWVVTNYLQDPKVGDGRYAYKGFTNMPSFDDTETITNCSDTWQTGQVHQYAADYIHLRCKGNVTLHLEGSQEIGVLPVNAYSGDYAFWSNKGDESDMTLSQTFDFTSVSGPLTMTYHTWYDIEKDYDYLYLVASTDEGKTWQILKTPSCTTEDPTGANYGCGYNGQSGNWIEQQVDLSAFAGKKVLLQFEYVTDAQVNGEGLLLDDVSIPQINYNENFENGEGSWKGDGFVRIQNRLPQLYRVSLIRDGSTVSVETITLDANQSADVPLNFGTDMRDAVLVISGVTRHTTQEANYRFRFTP